MSKYEYSVPFDGNVWSDSPKLDNILRFLVNEIREAGLIERWQKRYTNNLKLIVLNIFNNYTLDPQLYTAYSRNKNNYSKLERYSAVDLKFESMVLLIDILKDNLGYIEGVKGFHFVEQGLFRNARMIASPKFIELCVDRFNLSFNEICRNENEETIILKDVNKKLKDYKDTEQTIAMRANLSTINSMVGRHFIGLRITDEMLLKMNEECKAEVRRNDDNYRPIIDFSKTKLRRVFNNGSFEQGGRFYNGWWQAIPSKYRKFIRIDDAPTEEVDYSGLHINLMYAEEGLAAPEGDVYAIEGIPKEARQMLKIALQIMINSKNKSGALTKIRQEYPTKDDPKLFKTLTHKQIIEAFTEKHKFISHRFYTGQGVNLQYIDSQIAESVLLLLESRGIIALPVHDSFRVRLDHKGWLEEIMNTVLYLKYGRVFNLKSEHSTYDEEVRTIANNVIDEDVPVSLEEFDNEWVSERWIDSCSQYKQRYDNWMTEHKKS